MRYLVAKSYVNQFSQNAEQNGLTAKKLKIIFTKKFEPRPARIRQQPGAKPPAQRHCGLRPKPDKENA